VTWLESFTQDVRYGLRQLRQSPGFTAVAVASLALGIGANTAIFQLVDAVRLRTLPVEKPQELAYIDFAKGARRSGWFSSRSARLTYAHWDQIRRQQQAFTGVLAWSAARFNLTPGGEKRFATGLYVSADFFRHLGVKPVIGRTFGAEDDNDACGSPGAVLSYGFWQREFGGDPGAVGRIVNLDGHSFTIIGITPAMFSGLEVGQPFDVAIPLCADRLFAEDGKGRISMPTAWWLSVMGRLKPGWTVERANAHLKALSPGIMQATLPPTYRTETAKGYLTNKLEATKGGTGVSGLRREYETPLWLLMATTGLVLLIACANLANLLLARGSVREREVAVRLAIGASRWRLVRQFLVESLLLAVLGAGLGVLLAKEFSRALIAFLSTPNNPVFVDLETDWPILGFTALLTVTTCILFGLMPALRATRLAPAAVMRAGGRGTSAGRERFGLRRALVATQVSLSFVVLVAALLFVRSLHNLLVVDPGFRSEGILSVMLDLSQPKYSKERRPVVYRELLEHLAARQGVVSAAQVGFTPVSGSGWNETLRTEGTKATRSDRESHFNRVGPGYFRTMGTGFAAGRDFDDHDMVSSPKVAIVNEAFAKKFFAGKNPVGLTFHVEGPAGKPDPFYQIVGVVRNTKYYELREDFIPISFLPIAQDDDPGAGATFVLRTHAPMGEAMAGVKTAVGEVSPAIGIEFRILAGQLNESLMRERLMATLSGTFGGLAALLATLGLYGVISYMVARRRNEIGVRMALGADRMKVVRLVLREAVLLLAVGLTVGVLLALWAGRAATTLLFGLQPYDPITMLSAVALLTVVALAASYGPARRAAALDPMTALRDE